MCLINRKMVADESVDAWKVFAIVDGALESPFRIARVMRPDLKYTPNVRLRVQPEDANFYAFQDITHALNIADVGGFRWNVVNDSLLVLPVTLYFVTASGLFHSPSDDPQCMDGQYPAFEAKEIVVHDTPARRAVVWQEVVNRRLSKHISYIERQALESLAKLTPA